MPYEDIIEICKVLSFCNVKVDSEYMKLIYLAYYQKCKKQISKFGIRLLYYNDKILRRSKNSNHKLSKDEIDEFLKIAVFNKCLDEKYLVTDMKGIFLKNFAQEKQDEEKDKLQLYQSMYLIKYLYQNTNILDIDIEEINVEDEHIDKYFQQLKNSNSPEGIEEIARKGILEDFINDKKEKVLEKGRNENNIPIDVFCAMIINACASPESIKEIIRKFEHDFETMTSSQIFDIMTVLIYAEQKFEYDLNREDFEAIGKSLYGLISQKKGEKQVRVPSKLRIKLDNMLANIYDLLPKFRVKVDVEK